MVRRKTGSVSISPSSASTSAGVVVLPAGLVLLRAAVVVDGEDRAADLAGGGAEVDRGLAAVGADLERRAVREPLAGDRGAGAAPSSSGMKPLAARAWASRSAGIAVVSGTRVSLGVLPLGHRSRPREPPGPRPRGRRCGWRRRPRRRRGRRRRRRAGRAPGAAATRPTSSAKAGSRLIRVPNAAVVSRRSASISRVNGTTGSRIARPRPTSTSSGVSAADDARTGDRGRDQAGDRHRDRQAAAARSTASPTRWVSRMYAAQQAAAPARSRRRRGRSPPVHGWVSSSTPTAASAGHSSWRRAAAAGHGDRRAGRGTPARWRCRAGAGRPPP